MKSQQVNRQIRHSKNVIDIASRIIGTCSEPVPQSYYCYGWDMLKISSCKDYDPLYYIDLGE